MVEQAQESAENSKWKFLEIMMSSLACKKSIWTESLTPPYRDAFLKLETPHPPSPDPQFWFPGSKYT